MNIVYCAIHTTRGIEERLSTAVNRYTEHSARTLTDYAWDTEDRIYDIYNKDEVADCLEWADVIHCCAAISPRKLGFPEFIRRKLVVWQQFGLWEVRSNAYDNLWELPNDLRYIKLAVVAEGWHRDSFWDDKQYTQLPPLLFINHALLMPCSFKIRQANKYVAYAVMKKLNKHPAPKGFSPTAACLHGIPHDIMHKTPYRDCLRRKQRAWVGIDEVITPMIHFSGLEYLSMGVPCISSYDEITQHAVKEAVGASELPFIYATLDTLPSVVRKCLECDSSEWFDRGLQCRKWIEKYYNPIDGINRYIEMYTK